MKNLLFCLLSLYAVNSLAQNGGLHQPTDTFNNRTIIKTAWSGQHSTQPIQFKRVSQQGIDQYYVELYTEKGSVVNQGGAAVLFKDGSRLEWASAPVEPTDNHSVYASQCVIKLTREEIQQFQTKDIALIKLNRAEQLINFSQAQRAKNSVNSITDSDSGEPKLGLNNVVGLD